jgi:predicted dinucleotide-utilizing enzyme
MKVGIAGYGEVGKTCHTSFNDNISYQVTAASEKNKKVHSSIPNNIQIFKDYQSLIESAEFDAIEKMRPIERIYKADPIWRDKFYADK